MKHEMNLIKETPDFMEWRCPDCGNHVRVNHSILIKGQRRQRPRPLQTLRKGDESVFHSVPIPGLSFKFGSCLRQKH